MGINPLSDNAYYDYEAGYYHYEKYYTASDEADFQDFEEDLEEQDNLIMRRLLQEEEE